MRAAIVGGGITGPATALLLAARGHRITIFEKCPNAPLAGAGLLLQPAGVDVLRSARLLAKANECGSRIDRITVKDEKNVTLASLNYSEHEAHSHGLALHRSSLSSLFLQSLCAYSTVELKNSVRVVDIREGAHGVTAIDSAGVAHTGFDLIAICDGAESRLRGRLPLKVSVRRSPWGVFTFTGPAPAGFDVTTLLQRYQRAEDVVGILPIGSCSNGVGRASLFWNCRTDSVDALKARGIHAWREDLRLFCPESSEVLGGLRKFDELTYSTYADVVLNRNHTLRTVVMGDAAHAMNPELGLGATMGLLDADALSTALEGASPDDVPSALDAYEQRRAPQLAYYQKMSKLLSMASRNSSSSVSSSRLVLLKTASRVPFVRRRLMKSVSGYARAA